jgi:hypothetical protein
MTQKRIRPRISEELELLRKKRDEAVLAVGKIDREIDEAIAKAKIPQLKVGDFFHSDIKSVNDSNPPRWIAAIITGSNKRGLEPFKISHSSNLGIHCHAQTLIINICPPEYRNNEHEFPPKSFNVEWVFNAKGWSHNLRIKDSQTGKYEKSVGVDRWQIHQLDHTIKYGYSKKNMLQLGYIFSEKEAGLTRLRSELIAPDENDRLLDKYLLNLRYAIKWLIGTVMPSALDSSKDFNGNSIVPFRWYKVMNDYKFFEDEVESGEKVIFLNDGVYDSRLKNICLYHDNSRPRAWHDISFNNLLLISLE